MLRMTAAVGGQTASRPQQAVLRGRRGRVVMGSEQGRGWRRRPPQRRPRRAWD